MIIVIMAYSGKKKVKTDSRRHQSDEPHLYSKVHKLYPINIGFNC